MTHISKCLLHGTEVNLAPMILAQNNQQLLEPWHDLSECVHSLQNRLTAPNFGILPFKTLNSTTCSMRPWHARPRSPRRLLL
ncbi:hypothetical protein CUMW_006360 [Citrus unshiu]|nr:hypothetical protein CUMW_006360 [Citrus unshiu]